MSASTVVLLQPPASFSHRKPCLDDSQFGLGILALAAWLELHDYRVVALHVPLMLREGASIASIVGQVSRLDPLVVAVGLNWVHFSRGAMQIARAIRAAMPRVPLVVGGQHASLFAEEIARDHADAIDAVIVGEAELPLLSICESVRELGAIAGGIAGVRRVGEVGGTAPAVVEDLDQLPLYSYRSMRPAPLQTDRGALNTTRGACPFRCAYCIEPVVGRVQGRPRLTFHAPDRVAEQMARMMDEGITRFTIQDGFFVGGDRAAITLAEAVHARGLRPAHLNVFSHAESFTRVGYDALASIAARTSVDLGVETGAARVAEAVRRPAPPHRVLTAIRDALGAGALPYTWWLVGLPGEDASARRDTRALVADTMRAGGVPRWVSTLVLLPQTPIYQAPAAYGVAPRFASFDDYARFSDTTIAEALHFPDVITHGTVEMTPEQILAESLALRRFIAEHAELVREAHADSAARQAEVAAALEAVASSFF